MFTVTTRPGTCIEAVEEHVPLERVVQILVQLPAAESLRIVREPGAGDRRDTVDWLIDKLGAAEYPGPIPMPGEQSPGWRTR